MVLKLYGSAMSACTRRVGVTLVEKKVPFEFHSVDLPKGEHKSPAYLRFQPFGQIPYLDDDGFIVHESRAISRYIVARFPDRGTQGLVVGPTDDAKKHALFEQAASIEQSSFDPYASAAVVENVFKPRSGGTPDPQVFEKHIAHLSAKLDVYDQILARQKYLAGDEITLADLFHLPFGSLLFVAGSDVMTSKPNVARWWYDISSRPSWLAVKDGVKTVE